MAAIGALPPLFSHATLDRIFPKAVSCGAAKQRRPEWRLRGAQLGSAVTNCATRAAVLLGISIKNSCAHSNSITTNSRPLFDRE